MTQKYIIHPNKQINNNIDYPTIKLHNHPTTQQDQQLTIQTTTALYAKRQTEKKLRN